MTVNELFWIAMAIVVCIILPICMVIGAQQHLRGGNRQKDRNRAGGAVGNALQELDRIVARPSIEYTIEAEMPILKREDDRGGD
jgi:hypothetical protein